MKIGDPFVKIGIERFGRLDFNGDYFAIVFDDQINFIAMVTGNSRAHLRTSAIIARLTMPERIGDFCTIVKYNLRSVQTTSMGRLHCAGKFIGFRVALPLGQQ